MKNKIFSILALMAIVFASLLGTFGCSSEKAPAESTEKIPVVLKLAGGDWGFPNPYKHYPRGPGGFKMELIFDSLLEKDENGPIPWLAEKWEISPDGKEYTFSLRENVTWHDGAEFSAEDVKFSFDYYKEFPTVWNELYVNGKYIVEKAEVVDQNTVKLTVDAANATYLARLGVARIIPKHIWEAVSDPTKFEDPESAIGCGPYTYVSYDSALGAYKLDAFEDYWGPKQRVSSIEWVPVSDPVLAFEQGDIDLIAITPDILSRYQNNDEFQIVQNQPFWGYRLIMNMEKRPELKDLDLRKAIAYGLDREELVEKIARGSGVVGSIGVLPPGHVFYNDQIEKYTFEPEKSKELLGGQSLTLELLSANSSEEVKIAELMKISLEKAGITVNVKSVDMKTRDAAVKKGDYELVLTGHGGWGKDADYMRDYFGSNNPEIGSKSPSSGAIPGYFNQEIYDLCQKQMGQLDPEERKATFYQLQELVAADVPMIPVFYPIDNFVFRPAKYDGWMLRFDHHYMEHCKLSYLERE